MTTTTPLFVCGRLATTPGALDALARNQVEHPEAPGVFHLLTRHLGGDWGDVSTADASENDWSVRNGCRILSSYRLGDQTRIWIITEADRSSSTFLLPEEY